LGAPKSQWLNDATLQWLNDRMDHTECLTYLTDLGHELRGLKFDLRAIELVTDGLGHPESKYPCAIVAGTNGKGSTAAMLASIMESAGYRTGLYTSPHLVRVNERIRVDGREIGDEEFAGSFSEVRRVVDILVEAKLLPQRPSFFEFLTATAFLHFARVGVDFAVFEVGMGGRLDATNIVEPRVAIITNVDLDHTEFLGDTHAAIAREKAGVIKECRPVVSGCEHLEASEVVRRRCAELGAELLETARFAKLSNLRSQNGRCSFDLALNGDRFTDLTSPLAGKFQVRNAAMAVAAAWLLSREDLNVSRGAIVEGLRRARWPGRLEVIHHRPLVLLDGAHNPAAARELADFVREELPGRRLRLVYASMRDKAINEISATLFPLAEEVYLTRPELERAASPEEILSTARIDPGKTVVESVPARAVERACRAAAADDVVLVAGSLFLVGAIKQATQEGKLVME
jgi:dihydrofolate synthase / folylpolyglutamate synthase